MLDEKKAALNIAGFDYPTRRGTFGIRAAFSVHQRAANRERRKIKEENEDPQLNLISRKLIPK